MTSSGIHVEEHGEGPPLLLLHGIGSSAACFADQVGPLSATHRVLAWDAPGYRRSADPDAAPGIDGYADAAAEVIEEHRAAPAHVLGVSWGGVIAVRLALRRPDLVRSLILADTSRGAGGHPAQAAAMVERAGLLDELGAEAFAAGRAKALVTDAAPVALLDLLAGDMAASLRQPSYLWACESMAETDHSDRFAEIDVPTLVVVGADDQVTPVKASERIAEHVPGARLIVIPDAGHVANQERPESFNAAVVDFLAEFG